MEAFFPLRAVISGLIGTGMLVSTMLVPPLYAQSPVTDLTQTELSVSQSEQISIASEEVPVTEATTEPVVPEAVNEQVFLPSVQVDEDSEASRTEELVAPEAEATMESVQPEAEETAELVVLAPANNYVFIPALQSQGVEEEATLSVAASELISADGFESSNFNAWGGNVNDGGDLSVTQVARMIGNQGMAATVDDNIAIYVIDEKPAAEPRYRARFYFDPNSIKMGSSDSHFILQGYSSSTVVMGVELRFYGGKYQLRTGHRTDSSTWRYSSWINIIDAPQHVEVDWRASTKAGHNDGFMTLWVANLKKVSVTKTDNDTHRIERARLGAVADIDSGTRGQYFFDAFESRESTYIGLAGTITASKDPATPVPTQTPAPTSTPTQTPAPTSTPTQTPAPTLTPTQTPAPTSTPTAIAVWTPTPAPTSSLVNAVAPVLDNPMAQRHADAGIWVTYRGNNTTEDLQKPYIKGIMAYMSWATLWPSNDTFNWTPLRSELDYIINTVGKQAFIEVSAGYCPNNPWPAPMRAVIAERKTVSSQECKPLQFYDPQYLAMYKKYIRALALEMARFDSTDKNPTETNILFVRAAEMGETMENLPNDNTMGEWEASDFNPAPNGRIYQVNLTKELKWQYYEAVLTLYRNELNGAYAAVGLPSPAMPGARGASTYWGKTPLGDWIIDQGMLLDSHAAGPAPQGEYYDMYLGTQSLKTRATLETGGFWNGAGAWLGQYSYWESLANLHLGVEFMGTYGNSKAHSTLQPKGPISWLPNQETMLFADKYAGEHRNPATAPGVFIALRGGYFEENFGSVFMKRWIGNYEGGIQQLRVQDSMALYGLDYVEGQGQVNPIIKRDKEINWANEMTLCLQKYSQRECEPAAQAPDLYIGETNGVKQYAYKKSNLGTVRWCDADMFCASGTATRTETMPWARRTNGQPMHLDINNAFAASLNGTVTVRVVYLDQGSGKWALIADGNSVLTVTKSGSNIWKEAFVTVPAGALDLALDPLGDGDDIFHLIEVVRN